MSAQQALSAAHKKTAPAEEQRYKKTKCLAPFALLKKG
jgi:hypothetical protein